MSISSNHYSSNSFSSTATSDSSSHSSSSPPPLTPSTDKSASSTISFNSSTSNSSSSNPHSSSSSSCSSSCSHSTSCPVDCSHSSAAMHVSLTPSQLHNMQQQQCIQQQQQPHMSNTTQLQVTTSNNPSVPVATAPTRSKASPQTPSQSGTYSAIISLLGCILTQLIQYESSQYPNGRGPITMFHTAYVPSISISSYLKRIVMHTQISMEAVIQSVLHIHQMMQRQHNPIIVNALNIHRLLLTSIMVTSKFFDDQHYNNAYFSYIGGISLKELNHLEVEFLSLLNFDFYVSFSTYQYFYHMILDPSIHRADVCKCHMYLEFVPRELNEIQDPHISPDEQSIFEAIHGRQDSVQHMEIDSNNTAKSSVPNVVVAPAPAPSASIVPASTAAVATASQVSAPAPTAAAAAAAVPAATYFIKISQDNMFDKEKENIHMCTPTNKMVEKHSSSHLAAAVASSRRASSHTHTHTHTKHRHASSLSLSHSQSSAYPYYRDRSHGGVSPTRSPVSSSSISFSSNDLSVSYSHLSVQSHMGSPMRT